MFVITQKQLLPRVLIVRSGISRHRHVAETVLRYNSTSVPMDLKFGHHDLSPDQVFFESKLSFGIVNLKPIVPGHVLFIPKRVCARIEDLSAEEVTDLFASVHQTSPLLQSHFGGSALNIAIQDGADAGQSVPHVHVHVLPRHRGDLERNDEVYEKLDVYGSEFRRPRTIEEMREESRTLQRLVPSANVPSFAVV